MLQWEIIAVALSVYQGRTILLTIISLLAISVSQTDILLIQSFIIGFFLKSLSTSLWGANPAIPSNTPMVSVVSTSAKCISISYKGERTYVLFYIQFIVDCWLLWVRLSVSMGSQSSRPQPTDENFSNHSSINFVSEEASVNEAETSKKGEEMYSDETNLLGNR